MAHDAAERVAEAVAMPVEEQLARQPHAALPGPTVMHAVAYDLRNRRIHTYEALDNFWKRYNKVLLDKLAMERERSLLDEENRELRDILKQYLDGKWLAATCALTLTAQPCRARTLCCGHRAVG